LRRHRGLSDRTIFHAWRIADRFLQFRFGDEVGTSRRLPRIISCPLCKRCDGGSRFATRRTLLICGTSSAIYSRLARR
jgi:hypothetical protein